MPASFSSTSYSPDRLINGNADELVAVKITVISGQNLVRGSLLGKITASGKHNLSLTGAADGSQAPDAILAEDCDASGGDKSALAYVRGDFNSSAVTFGAAHTAVSTFDALRDKGIYLFNTVGA